MYVIVASADDSAESAKQNANAVTVNSEHAHAGAHHEGMSPIDEYVDGHETSGMLDEYDDDDWGMIDEYDDDNWGMIDEYDGDDWGTIDEYDGDNSGTGINASVWGAYVMCIVDIIVGGCLCILVSVYILFMPTWWMIERLHVTVIII